MNLRVDWNSDRHSQLDIFFLSFSSPVEEKLLCCGLCPSRERSGMAESVLKHIWGFCSLCETSGRTSWWMRRLICKSTLLIYCMGNKFLCCADHSTSHTPVWKLTLVFNTIAVLMLNWIGVSCLNYYKAMKNYSLFPIFFLGFIS